MVSHILSVDWTDIKIIANIHFIGDDSGRLQQLQICGQPFQPGMGGIDGEVLSAATTSVSATVGQGGGWVEPHACLADA